MKKQIVSVDFGASGIRIAHLETEGNKFSLLGYAVAEVDCVQKKPEELGKLLKKMLQDNAITAKGACLSIANPEKIFIKKLTLPQMSKSELIDAIRLQLKIEFTAFDPDHDVFDYQLIREYEDDEGAKKIELLSIFAKRDLVDKYLNAAIAAGLEPARISNSVFNYSAVLDLLPADSKIGAILDIGYIHSTILVYQDKKLNFVRFLSFSTSMLSALLVRSFVAGQGKVDISPVQASQIMRQNGIVLDESVKLEGDLSAAQVIELIRPLLETLVKELARSFDFLKSEHGFEPPKILYLAGGGAGLKNLDTYLADQLKIKVEKLPLPASLEVKNINSLKLLADYTQLSGSLGMGLSSSGINLLPAEVKSQKVELLQKSTLSVLAVVISAVFIFSWGAVNLQIRDYKKRLNTANSHLASIGQIKDLREKINLRENYLNKIFEGKIPPAGLLKLLGAVTPSSIILDEFDFEQSGHTIKLRGLVNLNKESVEKVLTDFMNSLENSKFVLDANLVSSRSEQGVNVFEIECLLAK